MLRNPSLSAVLLPLLWALPSCGGSAAQAPDVHNTFIDSVIIPQDVSYADTSTPLPTDLPDDPAMGDGTTLPDAVGTDPGIVDLSTIDDGAGDTGDLTTVPEVLGGCEGCLTGTLLGLTCAPNGQTAIPDVKVWVETLACDGQAMVIETKSNEKGEYTLENVPCGLQVVHMEKGSFYHEFAIFVDAGLVTDATSSDRCFAANAAKIAVITGDWDRIEMVLDQLQLEYDEYDGMEDIWGWGPDEAVDLLTDSNKLNEYDVLFINCGPTPEDIMWSNGSQVSSNLETFLKKGGSLYVSDYAFVYFEQTWPSYVDFPADPYVVWKETVDGHVVDPPLFAYLGKDYIEIEYSLTPLVSATGLGPESLPHIEAYFTQFSEIQPIMMSFKPYVDGGRVVFTTFHNEEGWGIQQDLAEILNYVVFLL